ncbi:MAG: NAD-dependent epimerase/dehydratase family protein [Syntrophorhabdaceae bacterium]|nr:NAD-dependent epimerase/dehydratase family protein [Syntrophorhabdaceae bacterium]
MKVLVTGGCGFIASHVVDVYVENGFDVVIVDDLSTGKRENRNEKARLYVVDICSEDMEAVFHEERPVIVNHHAAQISVPFSVQNPLFDAEVNIKGTIRLLELSKKYGVKKFIFSSTGGAIYGDADIVPTGEDYIPEPASPYAISKFACEKYIKMYHNQYSIGYTILRYSNVYGPRQIPHGEAGVVSIFIEKLLSREHPVLNYFPEEPRGMIRDYCYVKDVAYANILATRDGISGLYNIGTGIGTHTLDLYRCIYTKLIEKGIPLPDVFYEPQRAVARPGDIRVSTLKIDRAVKELGWRPRLNIEEGIGETIEWYLNR